MTHLIGLAGAKRSGKNTVADLIASVAAEYGEEAVQTSFALKLKVAAARALGFASDDPDKLVALMDQAKEDWQIVVKEPRRFRRARKIASLSGRQFQQWFGTEAGRKTFNDDFWVDQVLPPVAGLYEPADGPGWGDLLPTSAADLLPNIFGAADYVVITDVRFPNEAERVRFYGGKVWEIQRPSLASNSDGHASETPLPRELVDRVLVNDGSLNYLRGRVIASLHSDFPR